MRGEHDLIIRGGEVVTGSSRQFADVAVTAGQVSGVLAAGAPARSTREIDASGLLIMPGGIDTHTHVAWPFEGQVTVDNWTSATTAAVLGGTTTIVDFVPPGDGDLVERCHARAEEARAGAVIDFALHPILTSAEDSELNAIGKVIADGFTSFKMYTTYEDRRIDDGAAWVLMQAIAAHGGLPGFHAENHEVLASALKAQVRSGQLGVSDYPESRPGLAEAETIQMVSMYAKRLGTAVYIFHVSGSDALGAVRQARGLGATVHAETCAHYLTLDDSVFDGPDPWRFVISPPIRTAADRADLWEAVASGDLVSVGSDHCAYDEQVKRAWPQDHRRIPAGAPGIEWRTPLLWSGAVDRGIDPCTFVQISSERAARALGLFPRKGTITVGSDADLVLWDPRVNWAGGDLAPVSPATFSLYRDVAGSGLPRHVIVGGRLIVEDRKFVTGDAQGRFIARSPDGGAG
jgi:dihydropyrimidinase